MGVGKVWGVTDGPLIPSADLFGTPTRQQVEAEVTCPECHGMGDVLPDEVSPA